MRHYTVEYEYKLPEFGTMEIELNDSLDPEEKEEIILREIEDTFEEIEDIIITEIKVAT